MLLDWLRVKCLLKNFFLVWMEDIAHVTGIDPVTGSLRYVGVMERILKRETWL